ncbi:histidine acid phosphatase [Paramyrothecium foliicola]|nr:histidine acid phosphatase [Paramyrothecium foliicola]
MRPDLLARNTLQARTAADPIMRAAALSLAVSVSLFPLACQAEEVLGVYIFHRHGDRTTKAYKPVKMTALGALEVEQSGAFFRRRYLESDGDARISDVSADTAVASELAVTAPIDPVLHDSALAFLQGLYPPTGNDETLANGTRVEAPLNGYQYIPVAGVDDAATAEKAESNAWLQGNSGCGNAEVSSNGYFSSDEYRNTYDESLQFYQDLLPVYNETFSKDKANFKNGYSIFDFVNVATIHNSSIPSEELLTNSTIDRLYSLASTHEWNLAYNNSEPIRAIAGSVLAGQIVDALEAVVEKKSNAVPFNIQFGAYGTFMAFFGLAQLPAASPDFYGICDYASSMAFELVTNATDPKPEDISVRFGFANGTANDDTFNLFPLFGQRETTLSWTDFKSGMGDFAIKDSKHWCEVCGNTDGQCASDATSGDDAGTSSQSHDGSNGISKPVAGVIGALVTLVVVLGLEAAVMLLGGYRLVKKSALVKVHEAVPAEKS